MNSLPLLLAIILVSILLIVVATNRFKIHPFLALLIGALFVGFSVGMPSLVIIDSITAGFGSILAGIGLIVVLGTVMGVFVEKSGALGVIADHIVRFLGSRHLHLSVALLGAVVSIPVFCDSGFIIMSRLVKRISKNEGISSAPLSLSLGAGLYTTHTLVPPTPGPIAVAGNLSLSDQIGMIVITGLLVSIPVLLVSSIFSKKLGKDFVIEDNTEVIEEDSDGKRMSSIWAITPVVLPILLITLASVVKLFDIEGGIHSTIIFLGNPFVALLIGCILSMIQVRPNATLDEMGDLFKHGINQAGPIILITGAGGAFGSVLKGTPLADLLSGYLGEALTSFPILIVLAFLFAALLKTAQGSSTSALVIGSAIIAPLLVNADSISTFQMSLLVMAFGGGAMTVSHANDSYFWVITQFSGFSVKQGYRGFSLLTLTQGLTTLLTVLVLYFISTLF